MFCNMLPRGDKALSGPGWLGVPVALTMFEREITENRGKTRWKLTCKINWPLYVHSLLNLAPMAGKTPSQAAIKECSDGARSQG